MAKTKDGILFLRKKERENLEVVILHTLRNINYGAGGSFIKENGEYNEKEVDRAKDGVRTIEFILKITANN